MKKILKNKIINGDQSLFDRKFLIPYLSIQNLPNGKIIFLSDLLEEKKNEILLPFIKEKPAMYSNVYAPKDELAIFEELFEKALQKKEKIHIVGVTLQAELDILEEYYKKLGFLREDVNAFEVDWSIPLVTVSVKIENLMWKGSDYKARKETIFFNPPIRESGENRAMFKGLNRGVIAGVYFEKMAEKYHSFLQECIKTEKILPLRMGKVLRYNIEDIGGQGYGGDIEIFYG